MDKDRIDDNEILYRVVKKSFPDHFINGAPTAALFMDEGGASVDRDGGRTEEAIVNKFKKRFKRQDDYLTSVKISAQDCRNIETYPNPCNNTKNIFHAEIHDTPDVKLISLYKAIQLALRCELVPDCVEMSNAV